MRKILTLPAILLSLILILSCSKNRKDSASGKQSPVKGQAYQSFAQDGAWCWFSDPRAVYYENEHRRTYAGWVTSDGDIEVGFYDHDTDSTGIHALETDFEEDDHNNPSLLITENGKLLVFYSKHSTEEPIILQRSANREEITEWEEPQILDLNNTEKYEGFSDTYTYTNPQYLSSEGKLYLFWRGSDYKPNMAFSDDMGKSWTKSQIVILPDRKYRDRRPYLKVTSNGKDEIHFAFTQGHPRREATNSIYYMSYKDGVYYKANGEKIADVSSSVQPPETSLVYDAEQTGEKAWIWDVAADQQGQPVVVYAKFPDDSTHVYSYARWNGQEWENHELLNSGRWFPETPPGETEPEPNYSGGISLDHENPNFVYLSRQKEGIFEIERWVTDDGGESWEKHRVTDNSANDNVRPVAIRNAETGNPLQFLWMNNRKYIHYTDFNSSIRMNSNK